MFGRILEGTLPSKCYNETDALCAFQDLRPRARLHALVIPKHFIPTIKCILSAIKCILSACTCGCCPINDMKDSTKMNVILQLHLHVLAPASQMNIIDKYGGTPWCLDVEEVIDKITSNITKKTCI